MSTYAITEVPPRDDGRSRFALSSSPTGIKVSTARNVVNCLSKLLGERIAEAEPLMPDVKEVPLQKVARTSEGEYALIACRPYKGRPTHKTTKSGKFAKRTEPGGQFLDSFFGGSAWSTAHDSDVYEAAREAAEQERFTGEELRQLNLLLALAVLARAGVTGVEPWELHL